MKKNRLFLLIGLAVASFALLTGFKQAGGGYHHGGGDFFGKKLDRILTEIEATDAQRTQIEAIKDRLVAQMKAQKGARQQMREQHLQQMRSFWTSDQADAAALRARIDDRLERQRTRAYAMADAMVEVHGILTPEQRTQVADLMQQRAQKAGRGDGMGKRQGAPGPGAR